MQKPDAFDLNGIYDHFRGLQLHEADVTFLISNNWSPIVVKLSLT